METVTEFLDKLANQGVKLSAVAGQLKCYAPKGSLTPEIQEGIARHKAEIIALLDGTHGVPQAQTVEHSAEMATEFPLSAGQKGLYILQSLHPDMGAYNVPVCFRIDGPLDTGILTKAWEYVLEQFPILTARVIEKDGTLYHRLDDDCKTTIQQRNVDFRDDAEFLSFVRKQAKQPFDLNRGPLTRIELFVRDNQGPVLLLTVHHIVFDGASAAIVMRWLRELYQQLSAGHPVRLSHKPGYEKFVAWEEAMLASTDGAGHARYWRQQLEGELPAVELPTDFPRRPSASFEGETLVEELPRDLSRSVGELSKAQSLPASVIFLGVFQLLLHRYTNQEDIIVGMPVMGRAAQQFAEDVGYFINMVPIRARCDGRSGMIEFLRALRGRMLDALYHSSYPFPLMLNKAASGRREVNPIFRVSYAYQNFFSPTDAAALLHHEAFQIEPVDGIWQEGELDLALEIFESDAESFTLHVRYNPDLYARRTIEGVIRHYRELLQAVSANPNLLLHEYRMLAEDEERRLLHELNDTRAEYPKDQCLHELFTNRVDSHADKTAVVCGEERLTYRELHERSRDLALFLQSQGVRPDGLVGVCMERSLEMVVALYGILEAGGAYVPLDPDYPDERLDHMVRDSQAALVLTQETLREKLAALVSGDTRLIALDTQWQEIRERAGALKAANVALQKEVAPHHLAYVIYTSGSTGRPKGVMNEHRGVVNRLLWMQQAYGLSERDAVLQKTPFSFDVSVWEFFWPLFAGATLVMARPEGHKDPGYLADIIRRHHITTLHFVPSMLQVFLEHAEASQCNSLSRVICSGEALPSALARRFVERLPHATLVNLYGPTEAAVDVTAWTCPTTNGPKTEIPDAIPIGRPIANTQIYILDPYGAPVPVGVAGELHIAGVQVARGYLNRPELTAERFVPDPFAAEAGARMYKTGDLARWQDDGNIEYLGRNDFQVKLRGFRIELGEIEARLTEHEAVREAVVVAREDRPGEKRLVAYYTASPEREVSLSDIRAFLGERLPEYMVPAVYVPLDEMPLSPNGKLDRKALPAPETGALAARAYEPPQGEIEKTLAAICRELLHIERVGRHDSFFELGGHSLLATQLIATIRSRMDVELSLRTVFERPGIAQLAEAVATAGKRKAPAIRPVDRSRYRLH